MFNLKSNYIKTAILILGSIIYSQEVSLSFGAVDETAGTMEILMENSEVAATIENAVRENAGLVAEAMLVGPDSEEEADE